MIDHPSVSVKAFTLSVPPPALEIITDIGVLRPFLPQEAPSEVMPMKALWDTGATICCITREAAKRANLPIIGRTRVTGVHGTVECDEYFVDLILPNQVIVSSIRVAECEAAESSFDIIIGMSVITLGDFAISHPHKETIFTFRIPSIEAIDFVADAEDFKKST